MRHRTILLAAALGLLMTTAGCGMTTETLQQRTAEALAATPATSLEGEYSYTMTLEEPTTGVTVEMDLACTMEETISADPQTVYMKMDMDATVMGVTVPVNMEVYAFSEEGVAYTCLGNVWTKSPLPDTQMDTQTTIDLWDQPADTLTLDRETTPVGESEAYRLSGTVAGDQMQVMLDSLLQSMTGVIEQDTQTGKEQQEAVDLLGKMDLSSISADVVTLIDTETFLPVQQDTTIRGLDQAMAPMMEGLTAGMKVNMPQEMTLHFTLGYEPVEPATLPEGAAESAARYARLLEGDPDNGDGTYTIQESGAYLDVATPDGYLLEDSGYDMVRFRSQADDRTVQYQLYYLPAGVGTLEDVPFLDQQEAYALEPDGVCRAYLAGPTPVGPDSWTDVLATGDYDPYDFTRLYNWTKIAETTDGMEYWLMVIIQDGGNTRDTKPEEMADMNIYYENIAPGDPTQPPFQGDNPLGEVLPQEGLSL